MATRSEVAELSATELRDFLGSRNELAEETLQSLFENRVTGKLFLKLTNEDLKEVVKPLGDRKTITSLIEIYQPPKSPVSIS